MAVVKFGLQVLRSSVKGLILVTRSSGHLLVCNPVTNEYVKIPNPGNPDIFIADIFIAVSNFGRDCQVYTLGTTRQWRSTAVGPKPGYSKPETERAFVGRNLHWLHPETGTEVFTYFSVPPPPPQSKRSMCVLKECLCLCDVYEYEYKGSVEVEVLLMRGEVWSKEFVIREGVGKSRYLFPIKMFEDGSTFFGERDGVNIF